MTLPDAVLVGAANKQVPSAGRDLLSHQVPLGEHS
jgi:hypothetical protein